MRVAFVLFYVALSAANLCMAGAVVLFGYAPDQSSVACAAFLGASGTFMSYAMAWTKP